MCGLIGMFGEDFNDVDSKLIRDLLLVDYNRGKDSTGVLLVEDINKDSKAAFLVKAMGHPSNLFLKYPKTFNLDGTISNMNNLNLIMGHNRAATQGLVDLEGAHPFNFPNLVGAHNGTVFQTRLRDLKGFDDYDIDSQIIFNHLSETGDLDFIWEKAIGALALTWYDKKNSTFNIAKNDERPLYIGVINGGSKVVYASEERFLNWAGYDLKDYIKDVVKVENDKHYIFNIVDGKVNVKTRDLKPQPRTTVHYTTNYSQLYDNYHNTSSRTYNVNSSTSDGLTVFKTFRVDYEVFNIEDDLGKPNRLLIHAFETNTFNSVKIQIPKEIDKGDLEVLRSEISEGINNTFVCHKARHYFGRYFKYYVPFQEFFEDFKSLLDLKNNDVIILDDYMKRISNEDQVRCDSCRECFNRHELTEELYLNSLLCPDCLVTWGSYDNHYQQLN